MHCAFTRNELAAYTARQLNAFFPDPRPIAAGEIATAVDDAVARLEHCFAHINLAAYREGDQPRFDVHHTDQYSTYIAYLGNALAAAHAPASILGRVFGLNRALHGLICGADTTLPAVVLLIHAVGAVLGKTQYCDYLVVTQDCTVGAIAGVFPTLSEGLIMSAGSSVIGGCTIGRNVLLEPYVHVQKTDVPDNVRVAGPAPHTFVPQQERAMQHYFRLP